MNLNGRSVPADLNSVPCMILNLVKLQCKKTTTTNKLNFQKVWFGAVKIHYTQHNENGLYMINGIGYGLQKYRVWFARLASGTAPTALLCRFCVPLHHNLKNLSNTFRFRILGVFALSLYLE